MRWPLKGQRRVTEQQHIIGRDLACPWRVGLGHGGCRDGVVGQCRGAINDVMRLSDRHTTRVADGVVHDDEQQVARSPRFMGDGFDHRVARHGLTQGERVGRIKVQAPTGPHASGQRHRRQEATALGVPVWADFALPVVR